MQLISYLSGGTFKKLRDDLVFGYLENSFPYVLAELIGGGLQSHWGEFSTYQKDWKLEDAESVTQFGYYNLYTRYTKPILNKKLEELQSMKVKYTDGIEKDKSVENVNEDMVEFIQLKKAFQF